jgi:hypothetical protein
MPRVETIIASTPSSSTAPVYVPYATLVSALDALRQHGTPRSGIIDKTVWDTQSGAIQGQLILGFKFLGLIDDQRRALPSLAPLVAASAEERKSLLKKLIEEKYRSILSLDLMTISQGQLEDAFRALNVSGSTLVRATRFFIKACTELGIPIAKRLSERTRSIGPRKKRSPNGSRQSSNVASVPINPNEQRSGTWEQQLLDKFPTFDPNWPDPLKDKWFAGFERLMGAKRGE